VKRILGALTMIGSALAFTAVAAADHPTDLRSPNMVHVANDKNAEETQTGGAINSDLAFWENIAAAGNYRGFRLFDIRKPEDPVPLTPQGFRCNGGQGDVSFYKAKERLLLIQSVDAPQNSRQCNSSGTPGGTDAAPKELDWEGIRIIDVTNPRVPVQIGAVETACGSHTHTTIPDDENQRAIVYVSSYPLGAGIGDECQVPHAKISVVVIPDNNPAGAFLHHEQPIHAQPVPVGGTPELGLPGTIGCHDITAFTDPKIQVAAAACLTEGQIWDISDPLFPCTLPTQENCHTHIDNSLVEIWHSSVFTWDANIAIFGDEHGGGSAPGCLGSSDPTGNVWFYKMPPPRTFQQSVTPIAPPPLVGRYTIPRPQGTEECTMHNFSVIPINDNVRYRAVSSAYRGGTTVFDFTELQRPENLVPVLDPATAPVVGTEVAFSDSQSGDGNGGDDAWSSYWYNNFIYVNGGLGSRDPRGDRGFDVYKLLKDTKHQFTVKSFNHFNPQTQEDFETLGG
jgi:hypothetical protein